jgi:hypothetical protein
MATQEIRTKFDAWVDITITLTSLASGASRSSAAITNPNARGAAIVLLSPKTGAVAPTADTIIELFMLWRDDSAAITNATDQWGGTDAAFVPVNALRFGVIGVTATTNQNFPQLFDTAPLGPLNADGWGIAVRNGTNQALNATAADHKKRFAYYLPDIQAAA